MSMLRHGRLAALALVSVVPACSSSNEPLAARQGEMETPTPVFTMGSGSKSTLLGRAKFSDSGETFKVKRLTGDWHVEIKSKPAFDLAVQSIVFDSGAQSGWHSHPGPVFIQVVSDSMTFYESDDPTCTGIVRRKGEGYLDVGDHAHIARNETGVPQQTIVTYFAPPGAALRIDEPSPGNCPF
jgi:quercetin dioxygenase-like cupin family protein